MKASLLTRSVLEPIWPVTASSKVGTRARLVKRFLIGEAGAEVVRGGEGLGVGPMKGAGGLSGLSLTGVGGGRLGLGVGPPSGKGAGGSRGLRVTGVGGGGTLLGVGPPCEKGTGELRGLRVTGVGRRLLSVGPKG